jgi:hypothetical protein
MIHEDRFYDRVLSVILFTTKIVPIVNQLLRIYFFWNKTLELNTLWQLQTL